MTGISCELKTVIQEWYWIIEQWTKSQFNYLYLTSRHYQNEICRKPHLTLNHCSLFVLASISLEYSGTNIPFKTKKSFHQPPPDAPVKIEITLASTDSVLRPLDLVLLDQKKYNISSHPVLTQCEHNLISVHRPHNLLRLVWWNYVDICLLPVNHN